jgi:hypothetical protein
MALVARVDGGAVLDLLGDNGLNLFVQIFDNAEKLREMTPTTLMPALMKLSELVCVFSKNVFRSAMLLYFNPPSIVTIQHQHHLCLTIGVGQV